MPGRFFDHSADQFANTSENFGRRHFVTRPHVRCIRAGCRPPRHDAKNPARRGDGAPDQTRYATSDPNQEAAFTARLRELRWKNSAWLATADTMAGWDGFEIRNAGSGRSPVRKRSG